MITAAEAWIEIVKQVYAELDSKEFAKWLHLVGGGSDYDRCKKGEDFYAMLTGKTSLIIEVQYYDNHEKSSVQIDK